jgi:hypothetical protein
MSGLEEKSMAELVEIHNSLNPKVPAKKKTFSTKAKILFRIAELKGKIPVEPFKKRTYRKDKNKNPGVMGRPKGSGFIGTTISLLLREQPHESYQAILDKFHALHPEVKTSIGCVRWYASKLKKAGEISNADRTRVNRKKEEVSSDPPVAL